MRSDFVTTGGVSPDTVQAVAGHLDGLRHAELDRRQEAGDGLEGLGVEAALAIREICRSTAADHIYELWAETDFPHWILVAIFAAMIPPMLHLQGGSLALLLALAVAVIFAKWRIRKSPLRQVRARKLQGVRYVLRMTDRRIVPVLLDLQTLMRNLPDELDIIPALNRLLPTLEEQDACILSPRHRARLNGILLHSAAGPSNVDHRIAVLKALLTVGDRSSIPAVRRLAFARTESHFRETACICLQQLERRGTVQAQLLLRPLTPARESDDLLRSATARASEAAPEALLRSATAHTSEPAPDALLRVAAPGQDADSDP